MGKAFSLGLLFWASGVMAQDGAGNDQFFWHSCIALGEFHESPDIPATEADIEAHRKSREADGYFRTVVRAVCGKPPRPDCDIARFHDEIDETRAWWEDEFQRAMAQHRISSRSEFIVTDICMY